MSEFIDSVNRHLDAIATEMETLPEKLREAVDHLDRHRLGRLFISLEQEYERLLAHEESVKKSYSFAKEVAFTMLDPRLGERMSKLKEPSDVRIMVGKGVVKPVTISRLAREYDTSTDDIVRTIQAQGYAVFGWDQYQKVLYEISKLVGGGEKQGKTLEPPEHVALAIPVSITKSLKDKNPSSSTRIFSTFR